MSEILRNIWTGLTDASPLDQANLLLGIAGVWLMIRRSLWAFPIGLVAVSVQGVLFWQTKFYADARLQGFYFVFLTYGWWHWIRHRGAAPEMPVSLLDWRARCGYALAGVGVTVLWAEYQRRSTDAVMPYRDAFVATFGLVGQMLQVRKNLENWLVWVVVNVTTIAACLSASPALHFSAFLYLIYLIMAFVGWREWHRAMKIQSPPHA